MKIINLLLAALLLAICSLAWAETKPSAKDATEQVVEIDSDTGYFDGITNQLVYIGHVLVTDHRKATMHCGRLTIDLPEDRGHPTNIVAQTDVVVDLLDDSGQTNHITADEAIYSYHLLNPSTNILAGITNVVYAVTNETILFTNGNPTLVNPKFTTWGDSLYLDVPTRRFRGWSHTLLRIPAGALSGTNGSPLNFQK
jgi:lipopolysaccharide export system protein LptA